MGQKANLLTLRKTSEQATSNNLKYTNFLYGIMFLKTLKKLFDYKKLFLSKSSLNVFGNQVTLNLDIFFKTASINTFRQNIGITKKKTKNFFSSIYFKILKKLKTNLIILSVKNLNKYVDKKLFLIFFSKFKKFQSSLFPRRFNFFIDFIKLSILFFLSSISLIYYIEIIGQIFKILPKRRHNYFLSFIQQIFYVLIYDFKNYNNSNLKGVKLMLSGRIQAKPRAKFKYFQIGILPLQTINARIDFSKTHIYTFYGVFGLKVWVYRI